MQFLLCFLYFLRLANQKEIMEVNKLTSLAMQLNYST